MALRYLSPALNDAEFGFYFVNAHSRLPLVTGEAPNMEELLRSAGVAQAVGGALTGEGFSANAMQSLAFAHASLNGLPQDPETLGKYSHHRNSRQLPDSAS